MTDFPRIPLLDNAEAIADQRKMSNPKGMHWGLRAVRADLTSSRGFRWPFPGRWAECPEPERGFTTSDPCPQFPGDGLCFATSWRGMPSGGIPAHTLLLIGWATEDVLAYSVHEGKGRARRVWVRDVIDGAKLVRMHGANANLSHADLSGAYLRGANLSGAALSGAALYGAALFGADLSGADLSGANLRGAALSGADLSDAALSGADLSGADLSGANLRGADLSGVWGEPLGGWGSLPLTDEQRQAVTP